ncbi:MAG: TIGR03557 family F420-dependent LLM class oxidoreductase [Caulobacterales bacterium]
MIKFGYKLMTEEHAPKALVANAARAEEAGFDFVSISDHFHPWLEAQGHSPFAWSVLGAIAHATSKIQITTGLTCPIIRYHPAIVAQAAATIAAMSDNRFSLAIGAGERLNEHVTGERWPSLPERHDMLREAIDIFRALWSGGVQNYEGVHFIVDHARLYDLPEQDIPIIVGVSGKQSIQVAIDGADGIMATEPKRELVEKVAQHHGAAAPRYGEVALCYADSEKEARKVAHERFKFAAFGWSVNSELPNPAGFESAAKYVRPEDLNDSISAGPDVEMHVASIKKYIDAGFNHIVLTGIGPEQEKFIEFFRKDLGPALRKLH